MSKHTIFAVVRSIRTGMCFYRYIVVFARQDHLLPSFHVVCRSLFFQVRQCVLVVVLVVAVFMIVISE